MFRIRSCLKTLDTMARLSISAMERGDHKLAKDFARSQIEIIKEIDDLSRTMICNEIKEPPVPLWEKSWKWIYP